MTETLPGLDQTQHLSSRFACGTYNEGVPKLGFIGFVA